MHTSTHYIRAVIALVLVLSVLVGYIWNSLWYLAPEFSELESVFPTPMALKAIVLAIFLASSFLFVKKTKFAAIMIASGALCVLSWYHVVVSANTGTIEANLHPLYTATVYTKDITINTSSSWKISISEPSGKTSYLVTGVFPMGVDKRALTDSLLAQGNCIKQEENGDCLEAKLVWP